MGNSTQRRSSKIVIYAMNSEIMWSWFRLKMIEMRVFHGFSPFQGQYINITRESTFLHPGMECEFLRQPMELCTLHHWSQRRLPASPWRHSPRACYLLTMQVDRHHLSFRHDGINMDQSCLIRVWALSLPKHILVAKADQSQTEASNSDVLLGKIDIC
jgi:hypothetical protein